MNEELIVSGIKTTGEVLATVNEMGNFVDRFKVARTVQKGQQELVRNRVKYGIEQDKLKHLEKYSESCVAAMNEFTEKTREYVTDEFTAEFREKQRRALAAKLNKRFEKFSDEL